MDNVIGENIRRYRAAKPWTQEQLAGAARVDVRTVQRAEAGRPIAVESLQAIAGALDLSVDALKESAEQEASRKVATELKAKYVEVPQQVIERGRQLSSMISGGHALYFNLFDGTTNEQEDAAARFKELLTEWMDIYDEIPPTGQRDCDKSLQAEIDRLRSMGFFVSAGTQRLFLRMDDGKPPMALHVVAVTVSRARRASILIDKRVRL